MARAELVLARNGPSEPESLNQQQYGSFKVWTEADMYHTIVKRIALQNFLRVNQKDYSSILKGCSPDIHHRFGGHHALGGERHDREALGRWFERLGRLAPTLQLTVHDVWVKGWPWNTERLPREQGRQPGADHRIHRAKYRDSIIRLQL